jgi:hypothetical protein
MTTKAINVLRESLLPMIFFITLGLFALPPQALPTMATGDDRTPCVQATWENILAFILLNYVTHAMTVKSAPGAKATESAFYNIGALLLPFTGAYRGLDAIWRATIFRENSLQQAVRANALCAVVREQTWRPEAGDEVAGCTVRGRKPSDPAHAHAKVVVNLR